MTPPVICFTFDDPDCHRIGLVGGKVLGLADMAAKGLPIPPGFVISTRAHQQFLGETGLRAEIQAIVGAADHHSPASLELAEQRLTELLTGRSLPAAVVDAVRASYDELCRRTGEPDVPVAVRSSATAEDSGTASFAGEFETWIDVTGTNDVLDHVRRSYAAVYSGRALSYMIEKRVDPAALGMAIVIQRTVRARAAGVMFTLDPMTGDRSKIVIEASWGLGLAVVGGEVTPDRYVIEKVEGNITDRRLGDKRIEYVRGDSPVEVTGERLRTFCLQDDEVIELAAIGKRLERLTRTPQDIEFAIDSEASPESPVVMLQCRPETVWAQRPRPALFSSESGPVAWMTSILSTTTHLSPAPPSSPEVNRDGQ